MTIFVVTTQDSSYPRTGAWADIASISATPAQGAKADAAQVALVSGTNIKTVNGSALLGSGDVAISGSAAWGSVTGTLANQTDLQGALDAKGTSNFSGIYADLTAKPALFDGAYTSLTGKPTLGTAAATASTDYATSAQGAKADTALQNAAAFATAAQGAKADTALQQVGYAAGGAAVTQLTSKATGVTINAKSGAITTHNAALAAAAEVKFTVTNNQVAATDVPVVAIKSGGTSGSYFIVVGAVAAGSFDVTLGNCSAGSLSQAVVINFAIIKAVAA